MSAKTVTVEQLAVAMAVAGFAVPDREEQWAVPIEDAQRIFDALPDPEAFLARTRTTISDALSEAGVEATVDVGLATGPTYLGQAVEDVLAAAVAWRFPGHNGDVLESRLIDAVDRYRASTPEPKP